MSSIEEKREALAEDLQQFLTYCDQAEALITHSPVKPSPQMDFTSLVDEIFPLPLDKDAPEGATMKTLQLMVGECTRCPLCETRTNTVFGEGALPARLLVIGEGPGADEDATGRAFVGKAGQYLDTWLSPLGLSRKTNVYLANIIKCRPPENRNPHAGEVASCLPFVKRQIRLVKPELILLVGGVAAHALLESEEGVGKLRGRFYRYEGVPVLVTYHPAGVLRNPDLRRPVWDDMKKVAAFLNLTLPGGSK
ncbi:MAG: uracil-DNA glycosylase [Sphaerochaeta sp.]|nr:uracil-DNA glycosylase [Sphaerochaeta sp.]